jgi:hypothetical protein
VVQRQIFSLVFPLALLRSSSLDLQGLQPLALALEPGRVWSLVLHPLPCLPVVAFLLSPPAWVHWLLAWLVLSPLCRVQAVLLE